MMQLKYRSSAVGFPGSVTGIVDTSQAHLGGCGDIGDMQMDFWDGKPHSDGKGREPGRGLFWGCLG